MGLVDPGAQGPKHPSANKVWLRALESTARLTSTASKTFPVLLDELGEQFGAAPALLSDGESFSFRQLSDRARRYTRWALSQGLQSGDVVALMMPNRPEYLAIWLGVTRTGAAVCLLNIHLADAALAHCIAVARPKHAIVADTLTEQWRKAQNLHDVDVSSWTHGGGLASQRIDLIVDGLCGDALSPDERSDVDLSTLALLIYTSGTTGMPKAAKVSHRRILSWSGWFAGMMNTSPGDRLFNCLPMYHSVGGVVAVGGALVNGGAVVIKEKFSAREFWGDVVRWECTLFQYIGELCRYLLNASPSPDEKRHTLRLACGNGLSADVWTAFQERFKIPQILEFYAATEGNFSLYNVEAQPGAIGRIPPFLSHRFPAAIVQYDPDLGAPLRDAQGFCIPCSPGQAGEAIGRIASQAGGGGQFEGYSAASETERKILRGVFEPDDAWFRTGDLMRKDDRGFYYFVDRIGDTFRWKGENVATGEVAAALCRCPGVLEATVYGVPVPGADGKAGMAALQVSEGFDLARLRERLVVQLPSYARPLFIRLTPVLAATETFKQKKQDLVREGFDLSATGDPIFYDDAELEAYRRLDAAATARIFSGAIRL